MDTERALRAFIVTTSRRGESLPASFSTGRPRHRRPSAGGTNENGFAEREPRVVAATARCLTIYRVTRLVHGLVCVPLRSLVSRFSEFANLRARDHRKHVRVSCTVTVVYRFIRIVNRYVFSTRPNRFNGLPETLCIRTRGARDTNGDTRPLTEI